MEQYKELLAKHNLTYIYDLHELGFIDFYKLRALIFALRIEEEFEKTQLKTSVYILAVELSEEFNLSPGALLSAYWKHGNKLLKKIKNYNNQKEQTK